MQCFIDVTQEDIDLGERKDCDNCAVARAIRRKMSVGTCISVSNEAMTIGHVELRFLPMSIVNFIDDFDDGNPVSPFSFWLDLDHADIQMMPKE